MKKTMNMKKTFAAVLAASMAASATVADNQDLIESKVDSINAKRGLVIDGAIRAVAQSSTFDTDQDPSGYNKLPGVEKGEFVTGDLGFHFRPYENVRANAYLRLEAGMQEYFAAAAKSISVPWINVEGNLGKSFHWVVGDFRQQYSPLTLFMPGLDIMYEPQIFARKRYMAQKEQFLEGTQRNLQGVNLQFRTELSDVLGEIRAEGIFARLNRTAVLDFGGAEGNILPNEEVFGASQAANMDKWLAAGNLEWFPFNKNIYIGATPMFIFDNEDTYSYTYRRPGNAYDKEYERQDINPFEPNPQRTLVLSGRVGADIARMSGSSSLILDATAEFAMSTDDAYVADSAWAMEYDAIGNPVMGEDGSQNYKRNDAGKEYKELVGFDKKTLDGIALVVNANAGYKSDNLKVRLALDGMYNDSSWFNNAAQSPSFFAQRILNSDKDGHSVKYGVNSPLYSSFDALYNFNPKFAPVASTMGTDDNAFKSADVNSYSTADYNKNSYTSNVFTRNQLALLETLTDPALQMILPNGLATSNRLGGRANLIVDVGDFAQVQGLFGIYQQVSPLTQDAEFETYDLTGSKIRTEVTLNYKAASYMEFGGGLKVDVFKALGFSKPLELSGSYKHTERSLETDGWSNVAVATDLLKDENGGVIKDEAGNVALKNFVFSDEETTLKSDFINAGLYVQYLPRLGVNFGFQMINTEFTTLNQLSDLNYQLGGAAEAPMMKGTQMQWMVGLDYNIAKNTWLALNVGTMSVKNEYSTVNAGKAYRAAYDKAYETYYKAAEMDLMTKPEYKDSETKELNEKGVKLAQQRAAHEAENKVRGSMVPENLPNYADFMDADTYTSEFSQFILEASINVEF